MTADEVYRTDPVLFEKIAADAERKPRRQRATADADRYGDAIPVELYRTTSDRRLLGFDGRWYVNSTTATKGDVDPNCYDAGEPIRLGWLIPDGRKWSVYVAGYAGNRSSDVHDTQGHLIEVGCRSRQAALDSLVWHVACRGRTWLVSEVR